MLRIPDNLGDYYAYQLKLVRDKKVKSVNLERLDIRLGNNTNNSFNKHNRNSNSFSEIFEEETKKYR